MQFSQFLKKQGHMVSENRNLAIIAMIAAVNALGYGIIIPIIYAYSQKYGLTIFQNGLLFAVFSLCSFLSAPIIGRLSDKYGRRPLLIMSITGTALSFFMAAFAPNAIFLFIARALDGITAGNIPVASAVISDTTDVKNRAKGFGIIGASFGFGFVFGPAISAATAGYGLHVPFIIAGIITVVAVILTVLFLPETNKHIGQVQKGKMFDMQKLVLSVFDKNVGATLLISLIYNLAWGMFIVTFQPFAITFLKFTAQQIAAVFIIFGLIGVIMQVFVIHRVVKKFGEKKAFIWSLFFSAASYLCLFFVRDIQFYILVSLFSSVANSFFLPLIQTILSKEADERSQGSILGLNSSYVSIGNILGPILAGFLSSIFIPLPFLAGALVILVCFAIGFKIKTDPTEKQHAF